MAEDLGERTEQPTGKRLGEARSRGQLARSTDLSAAIILSGATLLTFLFASGALVSMARILRHSLSEDGLASDQSGASTGALAGAVFLESARIAAPILLLMFAVAYLSGFLQVGFLLSSKILRPDLNRLNPIKGLSRLFSKRSVVKAAIDVLKLGLIGTVVFLVVRAELDEVAALAALDLFAGVVVAAGIVLRVALWVLGILFILAIIDLRYQRWQHNEDLKMTKHEVKDERRASEGDIETKGRRLKLARQIAMQRLQHDVPRADVVVTNPTHFAVALKYDSDRMNAPRVVAKGADYLALKIRYIAAASGVPIIERPPLARALYAQVPVGREISAEHYEAVAEVLAYVYRLSARAAS